MNGRTPLTAGLGRLVLYTKHMDEMAAFYCHHFGYDVLRLPGDRVVELRPTGAGLSLLLHPAAKGQKTGQAQVKLVFDVTDVEQFCAQAKQRGLQFGAIHHAKGYAFANAKDPSDNSVSVSSRAYAPAPDTAD